MMPKIKKTRLNDYKLEKVAKLELKIIHGKDYIIEGYKCYPRGNKCVVVGKDTGNDFDMGRAAERIQEKLREQGLEIDSFRFAFI